MLPRCAVYDTRPLGTKGPDQHFDGRAQPGTRRTREENGPHYGQRRTRGTGVLRSCHESQRRFRLGDWGAAKVNYFVDLLSRLLEPIDRECICGDVEEPRLNTSAAAWNIVGLVMRRQSAEWSHFGPWAALLGVTGPTGAFLSGSLAGVEAQILVQARTYIRYGVAYQPGGVSTSQEVTDAATALLVALLCAWACGFVLSSLSGRAFWITSNRLTFPSP